MNNSLVLTIANERMSWCIPLLMSTVDVFAIVFAVCTEVVDIFQSVFASFLENVPRKADL